MTSAEARMAESSKIMKYVSLAVVHKFVPIALETFWPWGPAGLTFVNELGRRITSAIGDVQEASFLKQRLSLAVQRGNAASVLSTMTASAVINED